MRKIREWLAAESARYGRAAQVDRFVPTAIARIVAGSLMALLAATLCVISKASGSFGFAGAAIGVLAGAAFVFDGVTLLRRRGRIKQASRRPAL